MAGAGGLCGLEAGDRTELGTGNALALGKRIDPVKEILHRRLLRGLDVLLGCLGCIGILCCHFIVVLMDFSFVFYATYYTIKYEIMQ